MFFDSETQIENLIKSSGFTIFVINRPLKVPKKTKSRLKKVKTAKAAGPENLSLNLPEAATIYLEPEDGAIRIGQIRELAEKIKTQEKSDRFIVVKDADKMNEHAENAFLKILEEPKDHYHFAFFVKSAANLLPTILSRSHIYFYRQKSPLDAPVVADEDQKNLARKLLVADPRTLNALATTLTDKKKYKNPRRNALEITELAIEIAYKSYFATGKPTFLKKLSKLLILDENLRKNGHIKLHLIADLC